jgi:phosphopantothenoylcysteine decarboxylase/phosphopantothenate--cysteine ligase
VEGRLASGDVGMGRLADEDEILRALRDALPGEGDMAGVHIVVTSGGTREPLDPVRYIGNRSSGMMGHSVAAAAEARGARVTLVTASAMTVPAGVEAVHVNTAAEMGDAIKTAVETADTWRWRTSAPARWRLRSSANPNSPPTSPWSAPKTSWLRSRRKA